MRLKSLVPPLLLKPLLRLKQGASAKRYFSYEEARKQCGPGYDSDSIARVVVGKMAASETGPPTHVSALRVAAAVGMARGTGRINVIDVGGGPGGHFFDARQIFADLSMRWNVVETPAMVRAAKHLESDELRLFENAETAVDDLRRNGGITLAFSGGTLQCMPDPRAWLKWFVGLGADYLALVRAQLHNGPDDVINIQRTSLSNHGSGALPHGTKDARVSYPFTFCSRAAIEEIIASGYSVQLKTEENEDHLLSDALTYGYYCKRREQTQPS